VKIIKAEIKPGVCGQSTVIWAETTREAKVHVRTESECKSVRRLVEALPEINAYEELFKPLCEIIVMQFADRYLSHRTCAVPVGILKAIEAVAGLALPDDIVIALSDDSTPEADL
jgi:hypothetical protein